MRIKYILTVLAVLLLSGCGTPQAENRLQQQRATSAPPGIAANARVTWCCTYTKCGHSKAEVRFVESEMAGKTLQEYAAYHVGYAVAGTTQAITLERYIYQYCPDHYIIKDDGGVLALFRNEEGGEELARICRLRYSAGDLPVDLRPLVYEGIPYGDIAELEAMLKEVRAAQMAPAVP